MTTALTSTGKTQLGSEARKLRIAQHLTKRKLAEMAGVTREAVDLFEHNLPLPLDSKRRILRELWAQKSRSDAHHITSCL
jgi:transcriptional regulator with XRE-family HTH domain